jgi:DnaJ-class molecular chaperone
MSAFDSKQRTYRHRNEINILLTMSTGQAPVAATVFASLGERASDLMNDSRAFIPVRLCSGETLIVAKTQIASIIEAGVQSEENARSKIYGEDFSAEPKLEDKQPKLFDAYAMLRVSPAATNEEIRTAYKARMKAVHPDTFASLGLDEAISKAAVLATQKVNYAYHKIMRERGAQPQTDRVV